MIGKECIALAADTRFGVQMKTLDTNFKKIFHLTKYTMVGLGGLGTDIQTVNSELQYRAKLYELREGDEMSATMIQNLMSTFLYEHRFGPYFVSPIVAGLDINKKTGEIQPILRAYDFFGL